MVKKSQTAQLTRRNQGGSQKANVGAQPHNANPTVLSTSSGEDEHCDGLSGNPLKVTLDSSSLTRTLTFESLPAWMRDNEYIRSGYRRPQGSWRGCLHSIFGYLHNETVNIQTHLWGAVFFLVLAVITFTKTLDSHSTVTWADSAGFAVFLMAAVICLSCSAMFHTGNCHSYQTAKSCVVLDYIGILCLIVGSFFPSVYYGFYCHRPLQVTYLAAILITGAGAAYLVLHPTYNTPEYRWARTCVFLGLGFTGIVPVSHALHIHGLAKVNNEMGMFWILTSGAFYASGALLYAARVPERFFPGKLDYFGASHQIFHVHVVLAAFCHYVGVYTAYNHTHGTKGATCPVPDFFPTQ